MGNMTIGQLAKESGVRTDTIRYYETLKLVEPAGRTSAGYRLYNTASIERVSFIKRAKSLGFTLSDISALLELKATQSATCQEMLERTEAKIKETKDNVRHLKHIHDALEKLASACTGGDMPLSECPILDHLYPKNKVKEPKS